MKYDFDQVINRKNTVSSKWDMNKVLFGTDDVLDMWVADMDFPCPEPVVAALKKRMEHPVFGYTFAPPSLYKAIIDRMKRYYGWDIKQEWIVFTTGVVGGFYSAIKATTMPGDQVVIQPPVYYPFFNAVKDNGCQIAENYLKYENGNYEMDFEGLEKLFTPRSTFPAYTPRIRTMLLCSPHNPVGRVWTKEELRKLSEICLKYKVPVISDEIHCDLLLEGVQHTVTATLSPEIEQNTITLMAASKTFNLAGLGTSIAIIPNPQLRAKFVAARAGQSGPNVFGFIALEAAYAECDDYNQQLRSYITGNVKFFTNAIKERLPMLKIAPLQGTYLTWVNFDALGMTLDELHKFIIEKAKLALDDGFAFGKGGEGWMRFNMACPRSVVEEAVNRLEKAVKSL